MGKLDGKAALITGAGHGIGRATARRLGQEGARVVIAEINDDYGRNTEQEFQKEGLDARFVHTDVARSEDIQNAVSFTVRTFGGLNLLVNNAQRSVFGKVTDLSEEDWDTSVTTSLTSVFRACKYAIPHMQRLGGGVIVSVASIYGLVGGRRRAAYNATKGAIVNLTRNMALDYAPDNIRVNCVCPGAVDTWRGGQERVIPSDFWKQRKFPEPMTSDERARMHPIGREGRPEEIAEAILWLCDPANSFTTGSAIVVDGGLIAQALL
ncbi:MAG: glucose 1-dehydrogenase [Chloroflexi bacterium]|nr:glucose 1-dehydrogenase [Chloroflexota bacterium]